MKNFVLPELKKPKLPGLSDYLKESVTSFSDMTDIPIAFFDNSSQIIWECNSEKKICNHFPIYSEQNSPCRKNIEAALSFGSKLGEPYVFTCRLGLVKVAISLISDGEYLGSFVAGPFILGALRPSTVKNMLDMNELNGSSLSEIIVLLKSMESLEPDDISNMIILLNNCILASVSHNTDYSKLRKAYSEELKMGSDIVNDENKESDITYPYELEETLKGAIIEGDTDNIKEYFNDFLKRISMLEFGDLEGIKRRVVEMFAVMSRTIIKESNRSSESVDMLDKIDELNDAESYEGLRSLSTKLISEMAQTLFYGMYHGKSSIISNAVHYINSNYTKKINLGELANELHANQSYLSTLFKREMGVNFSTYLNFVRIKKSRALLSETNLSIIDISMQCGFEDQSYFTKVFRKSEGLTPKEFRRIGN